MSDTIGSCADGARPALRAARMLVVAMTLSAAGCRDGRAAEADPLPPPEERSGMRVELTEVARSGPEVELAFVKGVDVDSEGNVYVADWQAKHVFVLAPDLSLRRQVGRRGDGPGEFRQVSGLQLLPGDSLAVFDGTAGRLTVFAPDSAEAAYTTTFEPVDGANPAWLGRGRRSNEDYVEYARPVSVRDDPAEDADRDRSIRRFGAGVGAAPDVLLTVRADESVILRNERGGVLQFTPPFLPRSIVRLSADERIYRVRTDTLGVAIHSPAGDRVGGFDRSYVPPPVTTDQVDEVFERDPVAAAARSGFSPPESWPAVADVLVDDRARAWIRLNDGRDDRFEWLVFSPDGTLETTVELPPRADLRRVRGETLYVAEYDEWDTPTLVQYRIASS
jgi:hypothetical protein